MGDVMIRNAGAGAGKFVDGGFNQSSEEEGEEEKAEEEGRIAADGRAAVVLGGGYATWVLHSAHRLSALQCQKN